MDVDRPIEDLGLVLAVDRVEQLVAGQDAAVGLEQRGEQPELDRGQGHRPVADADLVAFAVEDEVAVADRLAGRSPRVAASAPARSRIRWTRRTSSAGEKGLGR